MDGTPPEDLLNKVRSLEEGDSHLNQELPTLEIQMARSISPQYSRFSQKMKFSRGRRLLPALNFSDQQCLNILQSIGQAVYIFDLDGRITYWNRAAGILFGYSAAEALGQDALELLADPQAYVVGGNLVQRLTSGESWTGQFPVKNKMGETFTAFTTNKPFHDDDGTFIGFLCVSTDIYPFQNERVPMFDVDEQSEPDLTVGQCTTDVTDQLGFDPQQPQRNAIASKFSTLAFEVRNRVKSRFSAGKDNWKYKAGRADQSYHSEDGNSSGASSPSGVMPPSPFSVLTKIKDKFHKISR
ncbi:uncharacterized protein LOC126790390 [Argentina anserina]|uniref:uncharacterized protein LOC126790390 n=1 Tax=Argentina anserina TaxID=57926 RepID=UPI0021764A47|nr:uncharacterized protein LOC126790390 [Potentilla anserina]